MQASPFVMRVPGPERVGHHPPHSRGTCNPNSLQLRCDHGEGAVMSVAPTPGAGLDALLGEPIARLVMARRRSYLSTCKRGSETAEATGRAGNKRLQLTLLRRLLSRRHGRAE